MVTLWEEEIAELEESGRPGSGWPFGAYLTTAGWDAFLELMPQAFSGHDMGWLASQMDRGAYWMTHTQYRQRGRLIEARVPQPHALVGLTYGEFNTAYVRAMATVALQSSIPTCTSTGLRRQASRGTPAG